LAGESGNFSCFVFMLIPARPGGSRRDVSDRQTGSAKMGAGH
jgi:hypothetical protein